MKKKSILDRSKRIKKIRNAVKAQEITEIKTRLKCKQCGLEIDHLWGDLWDLCDECGYNFWTK